METVVAVTKHKKECSKGMGHQKARRIAFLRKYPNYCKKCEAYGIIFVQEWFMGPYDEQHCPDCAGLCPRCMTDTLVTRCKHRSFGDEEYEFCSVCGWRNDDDYGDYYSLPMEPECVCSVVRRRNQV